MSRLAIHLVPNVSKDQVVGKEGQVWKIRIAAPPIDGKANERLIAFLADALDLPKSSITLVKGHASKHKLLDIALPMGHIEELLEATAE
jgi:uncharacterized protein (TIGR00251 family)